MRKYVSYPRDIIYKALIVLAFENSTYSKIFFTEAKPQRCGVVEIFRIFLRRQSSLALLIKIV